MNASTVAALAVMAGLVGTALGELVSKEIRGRLDKVPAAILRLAGRRLGAAVRDGLLDEWGAELHEILRGVEALPVTRLLVGTRFALGLLAAGPRIEKELVATGTTEEHSEEWRAAVRHALPRPLVQSDGLRLAACYLPHVVRAAGETPSREQELAVGGSWYGTIPLGLGRIGLVIGDVTMNGTNAATKAEMEIMVRLRETVLSRASRNLPPAELLRHLSRRALALGRAYSVASRTTLMYGVYDAIHNTLTYANAGHLSPVLRLPNGCVLTLDEAFGPSLDTRQHSWSEASVAVPVGSFLAFYTQGLVQRSISNLPTLLAQGPDQNPSLPGAGPVDLVRDHILAAVSPARSGPTDDVALMVAHIPQPGAAQYPALHTASVA
ncbi:PP2C family protein-serine/threonine phosphatase [Catenulispora rubra]|uniref:PP2C family protein-serine/threonine phosphatase n=1 Tax=Catenulispora rubra TaxID=280293 RepID=UPI0018924026|nr:SpoIIE family protein phosphatase [Catenulispora rubra]